MAEHVQEKNLWKGYCQLSTGSPWLPLRPHALSNTPRISTLVISPEAPLRPDTLIISHLIITVASRQCPYSQCFLTHLLEGPFFLGFSPSWLSFLAVTVFN
jgi:hypothetical protein